jgi:cytochrome c553
MTRTAVRMATLGAGVMLGMAGLLVQGCSEPTGTSAPAASAAPAPSTSAEPAPSASAEPAASASGAAATAPADVIARGKYLMTSGACNDCHSPKLDPQQHPDPTRPFSGRPQTTMAPSQNPKEIHASLDLTAWSGPWGVSYGANLTPDPETGLKKRYTEASFIKTLRTGMKPEGEALQPPMPWELYKVLSDDDLKAIWAYLQTIPAIHNNVKYAGPPPAATK